MAVTSKGGKTFLKYEAQETFNLSETDSGSDSESNDQPQQHQ